MNAKAKRLIEEANQEYERGMRAVRRRRSRKYKKALEIVRDFPVKTAKAVTTTASSKTKSVNSPLFRGMKMTVAV